MDQDDEFYGYDDDDVQWALPSIQREYEAALGQFLVRFNSIETSINEIIAMSLSKLDENDLSFEGDRFESKIRTLQLVGLALPKMHRPSYSELRELNGERNVLAHGHFRQNPYTGEYRIVRGRRETDRSAEAVQRLTQRGNAAFEDLRACLPYLFFEEIGLDEGAFPDADGVL